MTKNKQMHCYEYPRPAVTADILLLRFNQKEHKIEILLIQRRHNPFAQMWALPGGFMDIDEDIETCAKRELKEETNLQNIQLDQLITASKVGRDPRGRTVSVIFWAFIDDTYVSKAGDDAADSRWFDIFNLPQLAFDHSEIVQYAIQQLKFRFSLRQHFPDFFKLIKDHQHPMIDKILKN